MTDLQELETFTNFPWNKSYWFARNLKNTDKFGDAGGDSKSIQELAKNLRELLFNQKEKCKDSDFLYLVKQTIRNHFLSRYKNSKSKLKRIELLCGEIDTDITSIEDVFVFILTCEHILLPINKAIQEIPNSDKDFTEKVAKTYLDNHGEKGLSTVINLWDDLGVKGCLTAERAEIVKAFGVLRAILDENKLKETDKDIVLTAFSQEFERRAGQKRKGRAGGSLEDVTSFILDYFKIPSCPKPEHFQADIEIDKWLKTKDGWLIGISCKRTLRERWKQVSSADANLLSRFKIKHIYHLITYDEDLSDDKIALLGGQRHIFYLRDESRKFQYASQHVGLKDYVRPMSAFIEDLKKECC
jgi:hypothetical protein